MGKNTSKTEAIGVGLVSRCVIETWDSRFQEMDARNDDGIDAAIFLGKNGEVSGEVVYVQIKSGAGYLVKSKLRKDKIVLNLTKDYITKHRPRWALFPAPVILIYIDTATDKKNPKSWWVNLKDSNSYDSKAQSYILIPKENTFGEHAKGYFRNLCTHHLDYQLEEVSTDAMDFEYLWWFNSVKDGARQYYLELADRGLKHTELGGIEFNRVGWRHMTRRNRKRMNRMQSFLILGAIPKIIKKNPKYSVVGKVQRETVNGLQTVKDIVVIRTKVSFPHRYQSVITLVFKRKTTYTEDMVEKNQKVWFYSIFESRRGKIIF
jgi:rRNA maturation protein Rpf1